MRTNFFLAFLTVFSMSLMSSTCSLDDDGNDDDGFDDDGGSIAQVDNTVVDGKWNIIDFVEDGTDQTYHFNNFEFTFSNNGTLTASNGSTSKNGTWVTGTDDSSPKLILNFSDTNGPFEEISEDWRIETSTSTLLELRHVSGGDGSIDLLTFAKN